MKKFSVIICLAAVVALLFSSCTPTIRFNLDPDTNLKSHKIYIQSIEDLRPVNERVGYQIFYVSSITDLDYKDGFLNEFRGGFQDGLGEVTTLVSEKKDSDVTLQVTIHHFYGEYSQTVKTVLWEYGTALLLFIPRLVTDAIPYNSFAGRVAMDLRFEGKDGVKTLRLVDVTVTDSVITYKRGSADTANRLSRAASVETTRILEDVLNEL